MRFAVLANLILLPVAVSAEITGKPRITDGDTIEIAGQRFRRYGIDAPEAAQRCVAENKRWQCGRNATLALAGIVSTNWVVCQERDKDRYGRIVAVCNIAGVQGPDVAAMMVSEGWVLAYRQFSSDYVKDEAGAQRMRKGVWRGDFIRPWDWRKGMRLSDNDSQLRACLIKGNIAYGTTRIHQVPGGRYDVRTRIDPSKGERWFCTETEARAAGWRRSRR